MKYGSIVASVPIFQKLVSQQLSLRKAYEIYIMVRHINEELAFYRQRCDEIGKSEKPAEEKEAELNELLNLEIDWPYDPIVFDVDDCEIRLSANDLSVAEGLIVVGVIPEDSK